MANINEEQAFHLDLILELLAANNKIIISIEFLKEKLPQLKNKDYRYCLSLFYVLAEYYPKLLTPNDLSPNAFLATDYVPAFLHNGGFTALYKVAAAKKESEELTEKLSNEKLAYDVKNAKRIFKTYWWTFVIAILGFLLAAGKIIFDLFK